MVINRFPHTTIYLWTAVIAAVIIIMGLLSIGAGLDLIVGLAVPADVPG